jgi:hypothetical protein
MTPNKPQTLEEAIAGKTRRYWILTGIALGAAVLLRIAFLRADPPWDFTWSQALFTDGARAIDGAWSKVMLGRWIPDMRSPVVLFYPLANLLALVVFKIGGVGLAQANLVGVLPSLASVVLLFLWLRKMEGPAGGLAALILLAFPYIYVVYSRVPMVESLLVLMLLAGFWFALKGTRGLFVAGLLCGAASFMVKAHALHFVPVVAVFLLTEKADGRTASRLRAIAAFGAGVVIALGAWLVLVYLVSPGMVAKYFKSNVVLAQKAGYEGAGAGGLLTNRIGTFINLGSGRDGFFIEVPIISVLAFLGLLGVASRFSGAEAGCKPWERLAAIWFVGLVAALSLLTYRPLRYLVLLMPPVVLLATSFMLRLMRGDPLMAGRKPKWFLYLFPVWLAWVLIHFQQDIIYRSLSGGGPLISRSSLDPGKIAVYKYLMSVWRHVLVFGGLSAGVTLIFKERIAKARIPLSTRPFQVAGLVLLLAIPALHTLRFADYATGRRYTLIDTARSLKRVLSDGVFMAGDCATTLALETGFRTLPAYGDLIRYDEKEAFERYPITHFLLRFPTLFEYLRDNYPGIVDDMVPVRDYPLCGRAAIVVRMPEWPGYAESGYVPSKYEIGFDALRAGHLEEAATAFERFLAEKPASYEGLSALALCRLEAGRLDEARATIQKALALTSRDAFTLEIYGDILEEGGDHSAAWQQWQRAYALDPYSPSLQAKLGLRKRG